MSGSALLISPSAVARAGGHVAGTLAAEAMTRLRAAVDGAGDAKYDLRFEIDDRGRTRLEGRIEASVDVCCQRCLGPLQLGLVAEPRLLVGAADDDAPDAQGEETVIVDAHGRIDLVKLIEDELLLAFPQSPRHEDEGSCRIDERYRPAATSRSVHRPLAALEEIRGRG